MRAFVLLLSFAVSSPSLAAEHCDQDEAPKAPPSKFCEQSGPTDRYLENALGMHRRLLDLPAVRASYQAFLDGIKELEKARKQLCSSRGKLRALPSPVNPSCPSPAELFAAEDAAKDLSAYAAEVREAYSGFERKWKEKHERLGAAAVRAVAGSPYREFAGHLERELGRNSFHQDRLREGLNAYERVLDQLYLEHNLHATYKATAERARLCLQKKREACVGDDRPFKD
jgi:hypothetical protein